jgi:hypothetical protein
VTHEFSIRLQAIDDRLRPIAERPIDFSGPDPASKLRAAVTAARRLPALDEAGVRPAAEALLTDVVNAYGSADDATRAAIRQLFEKFSAFAWAATLPLPRNTPDGFRAHLLHFSILDQGRDPRDATLWLDDLVRGARDAGVDVKQTLTEVARLSSRDDRYRWGSTHDWLMRRSQPSR